MSREHIRSSVSLKEQVRNQLLDLLAENRILGERNPADLLHVDIIKTGLIDSMGLLKLMALIEDSFDVRLTEIDFIGELSTIDECAGFIASKRGN